jgi:hypothetical protein
METMETAVAAMIETVPAVTAMIETAVVVTEMMIE